MAESLFVKADEVSEVLGISRAEAYRIIKRLNGELAAKGYIVINGNINGSVICDHTMTTLSYDSRD